MTNEFKKEITNCVQKLFICFPDSFINHNNEFIAHRRANAYFLLENCKTELDVKCKVLEWFSRYAYKAQPYNSDWKNEQFHDFMLDGINKFLNTEFTKDDIEIIYTYLGNCCNHKRTIKFIESGYDIKILNNKGE